MITKVECYSCILQFFPILFLLLLSLFSFFFISLYLFNYFNQFYSFLFNQSPSPLSLSNLSLPFPNCSLILTRWLAALLQKEEEAASVSWPAGFLSFCFRGVLCVCVCELFLPPPPNRDGEGEREKEGTDRGGEGQREGW